MSDELLSYFDRELEYLREAGAEFARAHPKIAGRLGLSADNVEDPHVSRLIESAAFLNARVRKKLEDDLPELSDAILSVMSPHHLAPVPSMTIVQFHANRDLSTSYPVPAGTMIETDPAYGPPCPFRTIYDTEAWPVRITKAELRGAPFDVPPGVSASRAAARLTITLGPAADQAPLGELGIDRLRFFLRGQASRVNRLYELLHEAALCVTVQGGKGRPIVLDADVIRRVGFDRREALLPTGGRVQPGDLLLSELFVFPEKFQFVDIEGLDAAGTEAYTDSFEITVYLDRSYADLEQSIDRESFALGCTPAVNLFEKRAEPIELDESRAEYQIVPDARALAAHEVYAVDSVVAVSRSGERRTYLPFHGIDHGEREGGGRFFYHASRREPVAAGRAGADGGTEVALALVDLGFENAAESDWVLETRLTCSSRDLPGKLPFGGDEPRFRFREGGAGIERIQCLTRPTNTRRPPRKKGALWRVVSQLSLNHLSITGGASGAESLREILRVHDLADTAVTRGIIASIRSVSSEPAMIRLQAGAYAGFCRGTEVTLQLDEAKLDSGVGYLFGAILARAFAAYASVNSFVQLTTNARELEGGVRRWPAQSGDRVLL